MLRILIVDDSSDDLAFLSHALETLNFSYETASSGKKALDKINKETFDIVISDFQMDDGDGLWLAEEIESINPDIYFILVSSDFSQPSEFYHPFGVDHFLPKPISMKALIAKLQEVSLRHI